MSVRGHGILLAVPGGLIGMLLLPRFLPYERAQWLAAQVGLSLDRPDMFWFPTVLGAAAGFVLGILLGYFTREGTKRRAAAYQQNAAALTIQRAPSYHSPRPDAARPASNSPAGPGAMTPGNSVTPEQLAAFVGQAPPRKIPRNILAYRERQVPGIYPAFGVALLFVGLAVVAGFEYAAYLDGEGVWGGDEGAVRIGLFFALIGAPILYSSGRSRYRLKWLLRHGRLATGRIGEVRSTGSRVNDHNFYVMTVQHAAGGRAIHASCKIVGDSAAVRARVLAAAGQPAQILYDPADARRVLFVDGLLYADHGVTGPASSQRR